MSKKNNWKKRNQKIKRKKKSDTTNSNWQNMLDKGYTPVTSSFCPLHGSYTAEKLCACYKKGETLDYSTMHWDTDKPLKECPIHGASDENNRAYDESNPCGCDLTMRIATTSKGGSNEQE